MKNRNSFVFFGLIGVCLSLVACSPSDPLKNKVRAESQTDFELWKGDASDELSPNQWRDFNEAIQELKVTIEVNHEASGGSGVDETLFGKINGTTVGAVIRSGLEQELQRISNERDQVKEHIRENADFHTLPGDKASADRLAYLRGQQADQLQSLNSDYDRVLAAIRTYEGPAWAPPSHPGK